MSDGEDTTFGGLLDAEVRHRADPHSFSIPRSDVRRSLGVGDLAKLLFGIGRDPDAAERMWVEVTELDGNGYRGRLENEPRVIRELTLGAPVTFEPRHVAAVWQQATEAPRDSQMAIVSERVWGDGDVPAWAFRLATPDDRFSGWVVGAEADRALPPDDLAGYRPVAHAELTARYRSFDSIEDEPAGPQWRWDHGELEWRAAHPSRRGS